MSQSIGDAVVEDLRDKLAGDYVALCRVSKFMADHPERIVAAVNEAIGRCALVNGTRQVPKGVLADAVLSACSASPGKAS